MASALKGTVWSDVQVAMELGGGQSCPARGGQGGTKETFPRSRFLTILEDGPHCAPQWIYFLPTSSH